MIEISYFTDEVSDNFEESVRLGVEAGADSLEIRGKLYGKRVEDIGKKEIGKIKEVLNRYDTHVAVIGSPVGKCSLTDPREREEHISIFRHMCSLAREFETDIIRTFPFWVPEAAKKKGVRPDLSLYIDQIAEGLLPMVEIAEKEGVKMCFETEGSTFSGDCRELSEVLAALDSKAAKVTWDILNGWKNSREVPYPDGYSLIRGDIEHLHIKPNAEDTIETVGESGVTYEDILSVLLEDGYDGAASIEHWGSPELMLSGIRQLARLLDRIQ